jgi:hypothetical protein
MTWQSRVVSIQVFVQRWVSQSVLFLQGLVISGGGVFATGLIVRAFNFSETELEGGSPATLTFVAVIDADNADEDGTLGQVRSETAPPGVPLPGLVRRAGNLQYPVPDCQRSGLQTFE